MAIERWRPWEEFRGMQRMMDEMLRYPLASWRRPLTWWRVPTAELGWMPAVDVFEKDDKFVVKAELPGMKEEDIDVSTKRKMLISVV